VIVLAHGYGLTLSIHYTNECRSELSRRVIGDDATGTLFEWYGESGGQLKYYPAADAALWSSDRFRLEPLGNIEHGILAKAAAYFPQKWQAVQED